MNLTTCLQESLEPFGFSGRGPIWNREEAGVIQVIGLQYSKGRDAVTLNLGIVVPTAYETLWDKQPPQPVDDTVATIGGRLATLTGKSEGWWPNTSESCDELAEAVRRDALPFFQQLITTDAIEQRLEAMGARKSRHPVPAINLAILLGLRGDRMGACQLLADLSRRTSSSWRTRINNVAARIGCD